MESTFVITPPEGVNPSRTARGEVSGYAPIAEEYEAFRAGRFITERAARGLLRITGGDRTAWLQGFLTNRVEHVEPGHGNYTFACTQKGRVVFDAIMLVRGEDILLDVDAGRTSAALEHLRRFVIVEDVGIEDVTPSTARLGLGAGAAWSLFEAAGASHAANLPRYGSTDLVLDGHTVTAARTDFAGPKAFECLGEQAGLACVLERLHTCRPVGAAAREVVRIESGLPAWGAEITEDTLPGETGLGERAVALNKGCYLGQEIVARMHSRGAVARLLVGLVSGGGELQPGAPVMTAEGVTAGMVTSACHSLALGKPVGLAYVKADLAVAGTSLTAGADGEVTPVEVGDLPLVAPDGKGVAS